MLKNSKNISKNLLLGVLICLVSCIGQRHQKILQMYKQNSFISQVFNDHEVESIMEINEAITDSILTYAPGLSRSDAIQTFYRNFSQNLINGNLDSSKFNFIHWVDQLDTTELHSIWQKRKSVNRSRKNRAVMEREYLIIDTRSRYYDFLLYYFENRELLFIEESVSEMDRNRTLSLLSGSGLPLVYSPDYIDQFDFTRLEDQLFINIHFITQFYHKERRLRKIDF